MKKTRIEELSALVSKATNDYALYKAIMTKVQEIIDEEILEFQNVYQEGGTCDD